VLVDLETSDAEYQSVSEEMQSTIREHKDGGVAGGIFKSYNIIKVCDVSNRIFPKLKIQSNGRFMKCELKSVLRISKQKCIQRLMWLMTYTLYFQIK